MKLERYRKMRDPGRTTEPYGGDVGEAGPTRSGAFVIHQHAATRLHYDLRLEIGGVLASFAVPRGPSLDPAEKRLAVNTEDHPIEYLDFEAVIPAGQYGGGAMILWDRGKVAYLETSAEEGLQRGKIDFTLEGLKIKGRFGLIRLKSKGPEGHEWLLMKKADAFASKERDPVRDEPRSVLSGLTHEELLAGTSVASSIEEEAAKLGAPDAIVDGTKIVPMPCALEGAKSSDRDFLYELKLDGVRAIATKDGDDVQLTGRKLRSTTEVYPEVARAVRALPIPRLVLDGEILAFDAEGRPSFHKLGHRIHLVGVRDVKRAMVEIPVSFVVFDLLAIGRRDLRELPLLERKKLLARLLPAPGVIRVLDYIENDGRALMRFCEERRLEGVVAKRKTSTYQAGPRRSDDWIKMKCARDEEFVVVGFTRGEGVRDRLGALDLASYKGRALRYRGKVGSGLDDKSIDVLLAQLEPLAVDAPVAEGEYGPAPKGRTHVRPEVVVRVRFLDFSDDGLLRHPRFAGIRAEVKPEECTAAPPNEVRAQLEEEDAPEPPPEPPEPAEPKPLAAPEGGKRTVAITNRNKVLWPDEGYTKSDLAGYYEAIAPWMLRYLKDRPIMMVRYPDGIKGKHFYQWHIPPNVPSWIRTYRMKSEEEGVVDVFLIDDTDSLIYVSNLAAIPIHILAARANRLDQADFATLDFDVKGASLAEGIDIVITLRALLEEVGLFGFPKTSGQSGLHVFVPLGAGANYDVARGLAELLGRLLVARHPKTATMERIVGKRGKKVYVDTGQTGPTRTIVAPFSVRAQAGATVSTPLLWDEVKPGLDTRVFTIKTVPDRVAAMGDPMSELLTVKPNLVKAMTGIEKLVRQAGGGR